MTRLILSVVGFGLLAGCGGTYVFTAPDQIAPVGGEASAVLRLERQEVAFWYVPARDALVRFQVERSPLRAAFADKNGYAAATVPVGDTTGIFYLQLAHTTLRGNEFETYIPTHVWDPRAAVTAVDIDALSYRSKEPRQAAMADLAERSYIVYFTTRRVGEHAELREKLLRAGYPRGPIVQRQAGAVELLQQRFPRFETAVARSKKSQRYFASAGLTVMTLEQTREPANPQ